MDGTQARLKHLVSARDTNTLVGGKGGWDSGEIETCLGSGGASPASCGKGGWDSGEIETNRTTEYHPLGISGKGGWDSGEIETSQMPIRQRGLSGVERVDGTQARLKPPMVTSFQF